MFDILFGTIAVLTIHFVGARTVQLCIYDRTYSLGAVSFVLLAFITTFLTGEMILAPLLSLTAGVWIAVTVLNIAFFVLTTRTYLFLWKPTK